MGVVSPEVERLLRMAAHLAKYDPDAEWVVSTERDPRYHRLGLVKRRRI